jgi:hypothetical protein
MQLWQAIIAGPPTKRRLMVPLIILPPHSESHLLLQGTGVGGPFLGQSEGLRAPFFWDGPPPSTSFLEDSSTERARRSALRVGLRVEDSHQLQRSDASILPQRLSLQQPFSGNDTFAQAELRLSSGNPRSRTQVEPCDFCIRRGIFSRWGVQDGQKCPFKDSNVAAIMLTTPCRVSGDHSSLILFAKILLPLVSLPLHMGWETALFAGKYPMFA